MHVAQVERLSVGFHGVQTVGTAQHVTAVISIAGVVVECGRSIGVVVVDERVYLEGVAGPSRAVPSVSASGPVVAVPLAVARAEAGIGAVGSPSAGTLAGVVFQGVVYHGGAVVGCRVSHHNVAGAAFQGRHFQSGDCCGLVQACLGEQGDAGGNVCIAVGVAVDCCVIVVVATCCKEQGAERECQKMFVHKYRRRKRHA